jgi:glutamine amidotransferase
MPPTPRIGIVDYDLGNLPSVSKALERVGAETSFITDAREFDEPFDAVVLPGVGHFGAGARNLAERGYTAPLKAWAASGQPLLGICVGLQLLFERSEEDPDARGLGIVEGVVRRLKGDGLKIPHMGWNEVVLTAPSRIMKSVRPGDMAYFVHSFYVDPDPAVAVASTTYGEPFCSALEQGNVAGFQFHPEKSAGVGRRILQRFCDEVS